MQVFVKEEHLRPFFIPKSRSLTEGSGSGAGGRGGAKKQAASGKAQKTASSTSPAKVAPPVSAGADGESKLAPGSSPDPLSEALRLDFGAVCQRLTSQRGDAGLPYVAALVAAQLEHVQLTGCDSAGPSHFLSPDAYPGGAAEEFGRFALAAMQLVNSFAAQATALLAPVAPAFTEHICSDDDNGDDEREQGGSSGPDIIAQRKKEREIEAARRRAAAEERWIEEGRPEPRLGISYETAWFLIYWALVERGRTADGGEFMLIV